MAKRDKFPVPKPLTLADQMYRMRSKHPQFSSYIRRSAVIWEGPWSAAELGDEYALRICYPHARRPIISILSPILKLAKKRKNLPHVYADGQLDICVHEAKDWSPRLYIADTIMPWISEWIYFYEIWRQTGAWLGKGTHPEWPQHSEVP